MYKKPNVAFKKTYKMVLNLFWIELVVFLLNKKIAIDKSKIENKLLLLKRPTKWHFLQKIVLITRMLIVTYQSYWHLLKFCLQHEVDHLKWKFFIIELKVINFCTLEYSDWILKIAMHNLGINYFKWLSYKILI